MNLVTEFLKGKICVKDYAFFCKIVLLSDYKDTLTSHCPFQNNNNSYNYPITLNNNNFTMNNHRFGHIHFNTPQTFNTQSINNTL